MRNLSIVSRLKENALETSGDLQASCTDLDEKAHYGASVGTTNDALTITIWKTSATIFGPHRVTDFTTERSHTAPQVLSMHVLSESRQLCIILGSGDIGLCSIDDAVPEVDIVGSFDCGIYAASWSPDDSYLILVNGDGQLLQMTPQLDVLHEAPLSTSDFGEDKQNALGWGSKSTQFHGSLGKSAASAPSTAAVIGASPDDDGLPRISWRGDASFFCVSSLEASEPDSPKRRVIRVYAPSPDLVLHSTVEATPGLEHPLAWNPSGSLIASTQRYGPAPGLGAGREGRHDVVFFERNGLRRGGFEIVTGGGQPNTPYNNDYHIKELAWSCDSSVLAVWVRSRGTGDDTVQLWTMGNYHWYLKQVIRTPHDKRFTSVRWHPEQALMLDLTTRQSAIQLELSWTTCYSPILPPDDTGTVAVIDGRTMLITHFRTQNVPPPMSSLQLALYPQDNGHARELPRAPRDVALAPHRNLLAVLHNNDTASVWDLAPSPHPTSPISPTSPTPPSPQSPANSIPTPVCIWDGHVGWKHHSASQAHGHSSGAVRQIVIWEKKTHLLADWCLAVLASGTLSGQDRIYIARGTSGFSTRIRSAAANGRLFVSRDELWLQTNDGRIHMVDIEKESVLTSKQTLPVYCLDVAVIPKPTVTDEFGVPDVTVVGMTPGGKLYVSASDPADSLCLAENATSFTVTPSFIVFTTTAHEAHFVPVSKALGHPGQDVAVEKRRVERGSRIVTAVPSTMSLVLQMPRGNLETICPRPFVLEVVRNDVNKREYRKAFLSCRKHRVDLNTIVDYGFQEFIEGLPRFLDEIPEVDHINLFLTGVGRSSRPADEINQICDSIRAELEKRDLTLYVQSILTAHVVKSPPDLEAALGLLARLQASNPETVEEAVKYIIFLVDANTLFDTALGMYDFPLTLLIAQHSQRDPREYIPFLRELRTLPAAYQRFSIDDHLKKHAKALLGLRDSGDEKFDEAIQYIEKHRLHVESLEVWKEDTEKLARLQELYGDFLYDRREFFKAALVLSISRKWRKALIAYEKAHMWKEAFALTGRAGLDGSEIVSLASRVAEDLIGRKRHVEAARVLLDYSDDVPGAISALVQGNDVSEALRIAAFKDQSELVVSVIHPGVHVLREDLGEEITEASEQLTKQIKRYRELQTKKLEEPGLFYMEDNPALHNVEMMTDAGDSVVSTAFTRYTVAPSATSKASKTRTNKSRKAERKRGKKGTVDEEEYIIASFVKMVTRLDHLQTECSKILPHLLVLSEEHKAECVALQAELQQFEGDLQSAITEVWPEVQEEDISDEPQKPKKPVIASRTWAIDYIGV